VNEPIPFFFTSFSISDYFSLKFVGAKNTIEFLKFPNWSCATCKWFKPKKSTSVQTTKRLKEKPP
jgi:hypothetical protein